MPFAVSIAILGLVQAALVALPAPRPLPAWLGWARSPWWALIPALSIAVVIAVIELDSDSATWLSYLALVAVPPLAAYALGALIHGSSTLTSPVLADSATKDEVRAGWRRSRLRRRSLRLPGSLDGFARWRDRGDCALGARLHRPRLAARLGRPGPTGCALASTRWPRSTPGSSPPTCSRARTRCSAPPRPAGDLPRLQAVHFGSALMGFGDLFIAALVGCLLAATAALASSGGRVARRRSSALAFDLLFFSRPPGAPGPPRAGRSQRPATSQPSRQRRPPGPHHAHHQRSSRRPTSVRPRPPQLTAWRPGPSAEATQNCSADGGRCGARLPRRVR